MHNHPESSTADAYQLRWTPSVPAVCFSHLVSSCSPNYPHGSIQVYSSLKRSDAQKARYNAVVPRKRVFVGVALLPLLAVTFFLYAGDANFAGWFQRHRAVEQQPPLAEGPEALVCRM